jgi:hypothetical protein
LQPQAVHRGVPSLLASWHRHQRLRTAHTHALSRVHTQAGTKTIDKVAATHRLGAEWVLDARAVEGECQHAVCVAGQNVRVHCGPQPGQSSSPHAHTLARRPHADPERTHDDDGREEIDCAPRAKPLRRSLSARLSSALWYGPPRRLRFSSLTWQLLTLSVTHCICAAKDWQSARLHRCALRLFLVRSWRRERRPFVGGN